MRILQVDDEAASLHLTQRYLKGISQWDIQYLSCTDIRQPLPLFDGQYPDVVLVDYLLGTENGLQLIDRLREQGWSSAFILLTGYGDESVVAEALRYGVTDYISKKDFSVETLERSLRYVVGRGKAERDVKAKNALLNILQQVTAAANTNDLVEVAMAAVLNVVCSQTGWPLGHIYMPKPGAPNILKPTGVWYLADEERFKSFRQLTDITQFELGVGLPGRVFESGEVAWIDDVTADPDFIRATPDNDQGIKTGFAFPVVIANKVVGVVEFFSDRLEQPDRHLLSALTDVGIQLGRIIERHWAQEEQHEIEVKAQQSKKLESLGVLAGGIAHDFNNILQAIFGYQEIAMAGMEEKSSAYHALATAQSAAMRAKSLIQQILAFSRSGEGEQKELWPCRIVEEALDVIRTTLPVNIEIRKSIDTACGPILAEPNQIRQVILNLCNNSGYAMAEAGGVLEISLETVVAQAYELPRVQLQVSDTGCGMDESTLERAFEPFYTTKSLGEGTGLGLSMVHGIILSHGGEIAVASEVGKGTTVTMSFPQLKVVTAAKDDDASLTGGGGDRILYVDDEELLAKMGGTLLESLGYQVTVFTESERVCEALRAQPGVYDLIITDQMMPGLSGTMLAQSVSEIDPAIPIILLSGYIEPLDDDMESYSNIRKVLQKPTSRGDLSAAIRELLAPANDA